jgi:phage virion morphogenesis protein
MIRIGVDVGGAQKRLNLLQTQLHDATPLMRTVSGIMLNSVKKNFAAGGRPKWVASARAKASGGQTLIKSGILLRSFQSRYGRNYAMTGSNMVYAAIHQFGGKTSPHVIRARDAGGLYWPGARHPVKSVKHPGSRIPARPMLLLTDLENMKIEQAANLFLADK